MTPAATIKQRPLMMQFTYPLDSIQDATTAQLEKQVYDLGVAIDSMKLHLRTYPEDEASHQYLYDEIAQLAFYRKELQMALIRRCGNLTLPISYLTTNTYFICFSFSKAPAAEI